MMHTDISSGATETEPDFTVKGLLALPDRLDEETLNHLTIFAKSPLPLAEVCSDRVFGQTMLTLHVALPSKERSEVEDDLKFRVYQRKLGHLPHEAIATMASRALDRCKWFPTIAECLSLLKDWETDARRVRDIAKARIARDKQHRLDDIRTDLDWGRCSQRVIDDLPERWLKILETETRLLLHPDGTFTARTGKFASYRSPMERQE